MSPFTSTLLQVRRELGFKSGASFHKEMVARGAIDVNYPNYKKIESGQTFPRSDFVRRLAKGLPEQAERLIRAYCRTQFPEHESLFPGESPSPSSASVSAPAKSSALVFRQDVMTPAQVATIARSPNHYALYLVSTLARREISPGEIKQLLGPEAMAAIDDLERAKLVYRSPTGLKGMSVEYRFPPADTAALKSTYAKLDEWDLGLHERLGLATTLRKFLIRRVSPRYLPLIQALANTLLEQVRASDESDVSKNDEVLSLSLDVSCGKIPG